ncbi:hypothetical protein Q4595_17880, partial [Wenyingzhuangia sp. 1_MG-2023]|nr:hypothetical protein [Wenyingzhuangia sp. 1_MG-2023]
PHNSTRVAVAEKGVPITGGFRAAVTSDIIRFSSRLSGKQASKRAATAAVTHGNKKHTKQQ